MVAMYRTSLLLFCWLEAICFFPCNAFVQAFSEPRRPRVHLEDSSKPILNQRNVQHAVEKLRGGKSALSVSVTDYSQAASGLFRNIIGPASMLVGGLVPLGFLAQPLPDKSKFQKRLQTIYFLISVLSLANQLLAIMYATVASNKLIETVVAPATSVFALIQRDYELPWLATNVHFMCGLFGFISLIALRAYSFFPSSINKATAGIATSFLLGMISVLNRGVAVGDGDGQVFGSSVISLGIRYSTLLYHQVRYSTSPMALAAIALGLGSTMFAVKSLFKEVE